MTNESMKQTIAAFLRQKIDAGLMTAASVAVGTDSTNLTLIHEGKLSVDTNQAVDDQTAFDLQSMTKALITAPICMALENLGLLRLDDTIDAYIPASAPQALRGRGLTFRSLLCHTGGLSDLDFEFEFAQATPAWRRIFEAPEHRKPGESIEYCDVGYRLLGKLIEIRTKSSLEILAARYLTNDLEDADLAFSPFNVFNVAATPRTAGLIDDDQVRALGGIVGCDGAFGSARAIYNLVRALIEDKIVPKYLANVRSSIVDRSNSLPPLATPTETLLFGSKTLGWEVNQAELSYAPAFKADFCLEKAGGAGTFVWTTPRTGLIVVYLTNYGKPKPFDENGWNRLVNDLEPARLAQMIYATR